MYTFQAVRLRPCEIRNYYKITLLKYCCCCLFILMCLFSYPNVNKRGKAYRSGLVRYECGACPECLQKKSRQWALRCSMEAKVSQGMMVTLTYDTYKYDENGNIIGENLRNDLTVNKKDAQNFIKRLRAKFPDKTIKYLLTAEYGKRTHRPHYHALIFGLVFDDLRQYKKSKRGNIIYRSKTLEKIWQGGRQHKGGICTVDSINLSAKTARYCTKYCAKDSGVDDTFMLFSRGIGESELLKNFNGKSYWIDGREYTVPKQVWQKYIEKKYNIQGYSRYIAVPKKAEYEESIDRRVKAFNKKYSFDIRAFSKIFVNKISLRNDNKRYERQCKKREIYQTIRDNDPVYRSYIDYWCKKSEIIEKYKPHPYARILSLPDNKYKSYKAKALKCIEEIERVGGCVPPRSKIKGYLNYASYILPKCLIKDYQIRSMEDYYDFYKPDYPRWWLWSQPLIDAYSKKVFDDCYERSKHLPLAPCHNTANDRIFRTRVFEKVKNFFETEKITVSFKEIYEKSPF